MSLRRFNSFLTVAVFLLGLYIALSPFIPELLFLLRDDSPSAVAPYGGNLADSVGSGAENPPPQDNRLVIPTISLNEPIYESSNIGVINDGGTWHRPNSVTPPENGNSVIVGHRFFGSTTSTFYHLDKLNVGELFAIYWEGDEILYKITDKKVVEATETSIEAPTENRQLTLYTCTPIWTSTQRLVIIAQPVEEALEQGEST